MKKGQYYFHPREPGSGAKRSPLAIVDPHAKIPRLMSVDKIAKLLGTPRRTVCRRLEEDQVRFIVLGSDDKKFYAAGDFHDWIRKP